MVNKKKVPELRFKGFSDDWEQRKLGEVADIYDGTHQTPDYKDQGIMFLSVENIKTLKSNKYISEEAFKKEFQIRPEKNDILMTRIGDIGTANVVKNNIPIAYYVSLALIKSSKLNSYFLQSNIHSPFVQNEIWKRTLHIAFPKKINKNEISNIPVKFPIIEEQIKIGNLFKQLDNTLALLQKKLVQYQTLKKAFLQLMFPQNGESVPQVRFAKFSTRWEQRKLGDNVEFYSGLTYSPDNIKENGTLVLRSSNVKNGEIIDADNVYVDTKAVNSQNVEIGDVIVVVRNGSRNLIGKHAFVKKKMDNTVIGAFMTGIRSKVPSFTNALLNSNQFAIEINKNLGATINQITTREFKEMRFYFPSIDEQKKIGDFFNQLDDTLAFHQNKLKQFQLLKKVLLQKMFV